MDNGRISRGSSQIGEFLLLGVEEIIGRSGLNAVLDLTKISPVEAAAPQNPCSRMDYADVAAVSIGLEKMYGPHGGRGIAQRAGRAGFKYLLRKNGPATGITDLNFRLLPVPTRLKNGLVALGSLMERIGDEQVAVTDDAQHWIWTSHGCPVCWGRAAREPICHFTVGLLQEYFAWASSGRVYSIREVECLAYGGAACQVEIDKKALD